MEKLPSARLWYVMGRESGTVIMRFERIKKVVKRVAPPTTLMMDRRIDAVLEENRALTNGLHDLAKRLHDQGELIERMSAELFELRSTVLRECGCLEPRPRRSEEAPGVIVSVASYGPRVRGIAPMIESVGRQEANFDKAFLWLPERDFPHGVRDLPSDVVCALYDANIEVRWVSNDLGPHNKYYWTMREFPESVVVTLDDDMRYSPSLVGELLAAHDRWPGAVVSMRTHLVRFDESGCLMPYGEWDLEQGVIRDIPSHSLFATGVGGVLYPPRSLNEHLFDEEAIRDLCLYADDLWLKVMELVSGTRVVCPTNEFSMDYIEGSQDVALCKANLERGENDRQLEQILRYVAEFYPVEKLLERLRGEVR